MAETAQTQTATVVIHRYPMIRLGIRSAAEQGQLFRVVGETADPDEGLALIETSKPGLVILGMQFPNCTGFDVLRDIKVNWPSLRVLVYCDVSVPDYPERCLRAGAHGYVAMNEPIQSFVQAVSKIERGQIYLSDEHSTAVLSRLTQTEGSMPRTAVERLSESELGVLTFISKGMSNGEIARALHRSVKTVETYRSRIKRKVGVSNATALAQFAMMHFNPNGLTRVLARAESKEASAATSSANNGLQLPFVAGREKVRG
jgi:DNA-binding NarL/FixJ family response regulator